MNYKATILNGDGSHNTRLEKGAMKIFNAQQTKEGVKYNNTEKAARRAMEIMMADNGIGYVEKMKWPADHVISITNAFDNIIALNPEMIITDSMLHMLAAGGREDTDEGEEVFIDDHNFLRFEGAKELDESLNDYFQVM